MLVRAHYLAQSKFCRLQLGKGVKAILKKVGKITYKVTCISLAAHPTLLNLLANKSLDIVL